jgi:hypothetical protein
MDATTFATDTKDTEFGGSAGAGTGYGNVMFEVTEVVEPDVGEAALMEGWYKTFAETAGKALVDALAGAFTDAVATATKRLGHSSVKKSLTQSARTLAQSVFDSVTLQAHAAAGAARDTVETSTTADADAAPTQNTVYRFIHVAYEVVPGSADAAGCVTLKCGASICKVDATTVKVAKTTATPKEFAAAMFRSEEVRRNLKKTASSRMVKRPFFVKLQPGVEPSNPLEVKQALKALYSTIPEKGTEEWKRHWRVRGGRASDVKRRRKGDNDTSTPQSARSEGSGVSAGAGAGSGFGASASGGRKAADVAKLAAKQAAKTKINSMTAAGKAAAQFA